MLEVTVEDEIQRVSMGKRHVVILGAGASRAAFPQGDASGKRLPVMADFSEIVPVKDVIPSLSVGDFEAEYSRLARDPTSREKCDRLEQVVYKYFSELALPREPTLYDHLVLSLREKDVIATFNWDPFLIQAVRRNRLVKDRAPHLLFLHGNVLAGYCAEDQVVGVKGGQCSACGRPFAPSKLLYPVADKDYRNDLLIAEAWTILETALAEAFMVTIFGYGLERTGAHGSLQ